MQWVYPYFNSRINSQVNLLKQWELFVLWVFSEIIPHWFHVSQPSEKYCKMASLHFQTRMWRTELKWLLTYWLIDLNYPNYLLIIWITNWANSWIYLTYMQNWAWLQSQNCSCRTKERTVINISILKKRNDMFTLYMMDLALRKNNSIVALSFR